MKRLQDHGFVAAVAISGAVTAVVGFCALGLLGLAVAGSFMAPVNAMAHWLEGAQAAQPGFDATTLVALVTHVLACAFWAALMVLAVRVFNLRGTPALFGAGVVAGIVALIVDYGILPRALSPGWHLVLNWPPLVAAFILFGAGLGFGALAAFAGRR
ncbi:MAG TPA: hypothetical protein GX700_05200 [Paracoccus sp.]|nr:hypothetical protein [Paracoccus sp. (in: a-proteobacteria)]